MRHLIRASIVSVLFGIAACSASSAPNLSCSYLAGEDGMNEEGDCVIPNTMGYPIVSLEVAAKLEYDQVTDLAQILLPDGWAYVDRGGTIIIRGVPSFENGPEPFRDGLVRFVSENKYGFADYRGVVAVPAQYDGAFPFDSGHAAVCTGCTIEKEGEYQEIVGGKWHCIDTKGRAASEKLCER